MQNLINELTQPRSLPPSQAMLRAAKALQELAALHQQDLHGRLKAEQELVIVHAELDKLRKELNEKNNNNNSVDTSPADNTPTGT